MIIETFRPGCAAAVYARFRERGRMAPADVVYVASWVDLAFHRCFQVMEAPSEERLGEWMRNWEDLVAFEVVPVRTSAEASSVMPGASG